MFFLKKLIAPFLLPPGILIVVLLASAVWLWQRRRRGIALCNLTVALVLWGLSTVPVAMWLRAGLEKGLTVPRQLQGDVIILLGGGIHEDVPDLTGRGAPSREMMTRLVTAARLQRRLGIPVIVSGGAVYAGQDAEAPVIRRFLVDLGVPEKQVLIEQRSRDTRENAFYCREILAQHRFHRPLLVTSAYHMRRSLAAFGTAGVTVTPVPAQFSTGSRKPLRWTSYLPEAGILETSASSLHEYLGLAFYRLGG